MQFITCLGILRFKKCFKANFWTFRLNFVVDILAFFDLKLFLATFLQKQGELIYFKLLVTLPEFWEIRQKQVFWVSAHLAGNFKVEENVTICFPESSFAKFAELYKNIKLSLSLFHIHTHTHTHTQSQTQTQTQPHTHTHTHTHTHNTDTHLL